MIHKSAVFLLFGLILLTLQSASSQQAKEDIKQLDDDAKIKFVFDTMKEELRFVFRTKALQKIDDLERFANLEPGALKKARVFSNKAVRQKFDEFHQQLGRVERRLPENSGTTFTVNGKEYTFEGEAAEPSFLDIQFNVTRSRGQWQVKRPQGISLGSFSRGHLPFRIENDAEWKQSLEPISKNQVEAYENFSVERANQQLSLALTASLSQKLRLSHEQKAKMREFLDKHVQHDSDFSIQENLALQLDSSILESVPEFLTDVQKQRWSTLVHARLKKSK